MKRVIYSMIFIFIVFAFINVLAMDDSRVADRGNVVIVDANAGQELSEAIDASMKIVGIFGATPRYTTFDEYCQKLEEHYDELFRLKESGKSVKQLAGTDVNGTLPRLREQQTALRKLFERRAQLIPLFLEHGIARDGIMPNIKALVETASRGNALIHCFLPSYFVGAPDDEQRLHVFLKDSASYYQRLYEETTGGCPVVLFIPPLAHFMRFIREGGKDEQAMVASIQELLQSEVMEKLPESTIFGFINQDQDENRVLCDALRRKVQQQIANVPLITSDSFGRRAAKTFTPYVVKRDQEYSSLEAELRSRCLVTKQTHGLIMQLVREIHEQENE